MIRNIAVAFAVVGLLGLGIASAEQGRETRRGDVKANQWVNQIAQDDVQEVLMAKIALERAANEGVREFARTLIHDHAQVAANIDYLTIGRDVYVGGDLSSALKTVAAAGERPMQTASSAAMPERVFEREAKMAEDKATATAKESSAAGAGMMGDKMGEMGEKMEGMMGDKMGQKMGGMMGRSATFDFIDVAATAKKLDVSHQREIEQLEKASAGDDFDLVFLRTMVTAHEDAIRSFERAAKGIHNENVRQFATDTLPELRTHLATAKTLEGLLGTARVFERDLKPLSKPIPIP